MESGMQMQSALELLAPFERTDKQNFVKET